MKRMACLVLGLLIGLPTSVSRAQAPRRSGGQRELTYLDPKDAGIDYQLQGEYAGSAGDGKLAAQVVAMGGGKFTAVFLDGGLPGDGWDGKSRTEVKGSLDGNRADFKSDSGWKATIADGTLSGTNDRGTSFKLQRVERVSPDEGEKTPAGAVVLFDGTNVDAWQNGKMDARHLIEAGTKTKTKYQDFKLHVEFYLPFKPYARDQERGNSGIYIQDRYEIQVLDTFGHPPEFNGCGATYRQTAPKVNMCYPPLRWQTYDIDFHAAKFDASGKKIHNAVVTVRQNGVIVQDHTELSNKTGAGKPEGPAAGPIQLQGHNNPVFFRNIWVIGKTY